MSPLLTLRLLSGIEFIELMMALCCLLWRVSLIQVCLQNFGAVYSLRCSLLATIWK